MQFSNIGRPYRKYFSFCSACHRAYFWYPVDQIRDSSLNFTYADFESVSQTKVRSAISVAVARANRAKTCRGKRQIASFLLPDIISGRIADTPRHYPHTPFVVREYLAMRLKLSRDSRIWRSNRALWQNRGPLLPPRAGLSPRAMPTAKRRGQ